MAERAGTGVFARRAGCVLAALGAFLLVTGILLRIYVYQQVAVLPLGMHSVQRLYATGATFFDPTQVRTRTGLQVTATNTLRGDKRPGLGGVAVFDTFLAVQAKDGTPIEFVQNRMALDRHTGLLVNCCGTNISGDYGVRQSGLAFKFPFFSAKTTYGMFNADVRRQVPAFYEGQSTLDGMRVYRYAQVLPPSQIKLMRVPQSIMGLPKAQKEITVRKIEATTETFWVDPVIGAPVKIEENTHQWLLTLDGTHRLPVFSADFRQKPGEVAASVRQYRTQSMQLNLVRNVLPPVNVIGGLALAGIGALIVYRGIRRSRSLAGAALPRHKMVTGAAEPVDDLTAR
jgi:Porin PorA